jgi:protein gp37
MNPNREKIGWCDWTWNPITGCRHGCKYCYARKFARRRGDDFTPKFHPERLGQIKQPKPGDKVFVGSMADVWGKWVPAGWIEQILAVCESRPEVYFQFLTKNPARYAEFEIPANCWVGATITNQDDWDNRVPELTGRTRYASCEPLMGPIKITDGIEWLIIGGMTGPGATECPATWVADMIAQARTLEIPVYIKPTHYGLFPIREFPCGIAAKEPGEVEYRLAGLFPNS